MRAPQWLHIGGSFTYIVELPSIAGIQEKHHRRLKKKKRSPTTTEILLYYKGVFYLEEQLKISFNFFIPKGILICSVDTEKKHAH